MICILMDTCFVNKLTNNVKRSNEITLGICNTCFVLFLLFAATLRQDIKLHTITELSSCEDIRDIRVNSVISTPLLGRCVQILNRVSVTSHSPEDCSCVVHIITIIPRMVSQRYSLKETSQNRIYKGNTANL